LTFPALKISHRYPERCAAAIPGKANEAAPAETTEKNALREICIIASHQESIASRPCSVDVEGSGALGTTVSTVTQGVNLRLSGDFLLYPRSRR
jgi:hypothetical protein